MTFIVEVSSAWQAAHPGAWAGFLALSGVANPETHPVLEQQKAELEANLRARFGGWKRADFVSLPSIRPYVRYYARYRKTYHVLLQLESVVLKGKPLPRAAALVEAMFMTELNTHLLTAGHDLDAIVPPVRLDAARGDETYIQLSGETRTLKAGDMFVADAQGVLSSIIYGPDRRTRITPATRQVFFTVYAPPGISRPMVEQHLLELTARVQTIAPQAETIWRAICGAGENSHA